MSSHRHLQYEQLAILACPRFANHKTCIPVRSDCLPGADDDGSGSMSILEAYRALIAANWRPERAVEFHWYSAEVCLVLPPLRNSTNTNVISPNRKGVSSDLKPSPALTRAAMSTLLP